MHNLTTIISGWEDHLDMSKKQKSMVVARSQIAAVVKHYKRNFISNEEWAIKAEHERKTTEKVYLRIKKENEELLAKIARMENERDENERKIMLLERHYWDVTGRKPSEKFYERAK